MIVRALAGLTLLAVTGLTTGCGSSDPTVRVSAAQVRSLNSAPGGSGIVLPTLDSAVIVERRATVLSVDVFEGETVRIGQPVISVKTVGEPAAVTAASAQLDADQKQLELVRARDGDSAAGVQDLLNRIARDKQLLATLKGSPTVLTAAIAGRVTNLSAAPGRVVDKTFVVAHIVDDSSVRIVVPISASARSAVTTGAPARVSSPTLKGATIQARVLGVGATTANADGREDTVALTVTADNAGHQIATGVTAYVAVPVRRTNIVAVDSLAVLDLQQRPFVFVVSAGRVRQQAVVIGAADGTWTEIVRGISAGDEVVLAGAQGLQDGTRVQAIRADTPA